MPNGWMILGANILIYPFALAMYLAGISRAKNASSSIVRAVVDFGVSVLTFWAVGAAILNGSCRYLFDWGGVFDARTFVQCAIVATSTAVASSSILERSRFATVAMLSALLGGLVIPFGWRLCGDNGALSRLGLLDLGGASFLHWGAGAAAATAALVVGARQGKHNHDGSANVIPGHSVPLAGAGALLTIVPWIAYLLAMTMMRHGAQDRVGMNVMLSGAAGAISAIAYGEIKYAKVDVQQVFGGLLAGLVSVTAMGGVGSTLAAVISGFVGGALCCYAAGTLDLRCKLDDPAASVAIYGIGGAWAVIAAGLFCPGDVHERLRRLLAAFAALLTIGVLATAATWLALSLLQKMVGIRSSETDELDGLDLAEHDLNAYPDFQQTMIKSYHLREA